MIHFAAFYVSNCAFCFCSYNVPGLLGIEKGQTFKIILETLSELGYCVEWLVHDSAGFGVPQSRKRVYLAGCLGVDCSGKILAFGNCDEENSRKVKQLIGGSQGQRVYAPDGFAVTQCSGSGGMGGKTGLYLIDMNYPPTLTEKARCITARQDSGVSKHKGEHSAVFCDLNENPQITENARCLHTRYDLGVSSGKHKGERSGVLIEDGPRAILNPFKEEVYQNGRRVKEPNEPMFTLTVVDRHGIVHQGRIRRLMPIECWRLQGFTTEQFRNVEAAGLSDAQLYKQAGNAVTVNVVEALARNLLKFDEEVRKCPTM
ncbi:MAG: DNA (cytosine-5-)-methyltransferase [Ruminococcus sp.]|nr:DNA (cytosine-5-)-methyltransferase [Ruminococcus sp.]